MGTTDPASFQNPGVLLENNTDKPLTAGSVYTGEWSNVAYFSSVTVTVSSDVSGTVNLQFSPDKINVDHQLFFKHAITIDPTSGPHRTNVTHKYFRVVYTNGSADQTFFRIQSMAGHQGADIKVNGEEDPNNSLNVKLPTVTDMTNRIRISGINKIVENVWQYDLQPRTWSTRVTGSATISGPGQKDPAYAKLSTTTASGDKAELRTKRFLVYQSFRTHVLTMAMILGDAKAGVVKRFGQYTNFNGWYFEQNIDGFYVGYRNNSFEVSGTIDTRIERADWNVDSLDGTGPSGLNIANMLGKALTFVIEYVWHGTQGIKFEIEYFDKLYTVHEIIWSATEEKPFARSALLPINYEVENTSAVASATNVFVGPTSFNIEGGEERVGLRFSKGNLPGQSVTAVSTTVPNIIFSVRPKLQQNGINNRGSLTPLEYQIFTDADIYYEVAVQAIATNGTWTSVGTTSIAEYSVDTTTLSFSGYPISSGYVAGASNRSGAIAGSFEDLETVSIDTLNSNAQLAIVVLAYKISGNAVVRASIKWKETY